MYEYDEFEVHHAIRYSDTHDVTVFSLTGATSARVSPARMRLLKLQTPGGMYG